MPAGQDARAGGAAQGVGAVAAVKDHALATQLVEIGQGHGGIILAGAQRLVGVVVRNDEKDIRLFILRSLGLGRERSCRQQGQSSGDDGFQGSHIAWRI